MTATLAHSLIIGSSPFIWQNVYRALHVTIRGKCEAKLNSTPQAFVAFTAVKPNLWLVRPSAKLGRHLTWQATHSPEAAEQEKS